MPIGVPKVPYRLPGDAMSQWVDLYNRLYRERLLFLGSDLDDELANQLVGIMVYLNAEDSEQDLFLYINSPGGSVSSGMAVFDMIRHVEATVHTVCMGIAASMASLVLAGGEAGCRIGFPHCRIMLHQPSGGGMGQASDIVAEKDEILRLRRKIGELYAKISGTPLSKISVDMNRDFYLSAKEAQAYGDFGLLDRIAYTAAFNVEALPF